MKQFRPWEEFSSNLNTPNSYPVENITIPINAILSAGDTACSSASNILVLEGLPGYTGTLIEGELAPNHIEVLSDNSATQFAMIKQNISDTAIPVTDVLICPIEDAQDPIDECTKSKSSKCSSKSWSNSSSKSGSSNKSSSSKSESIGSSKSNSNQWANSFEKK